jgi:hypothetical protein
MRRIEAARARTVSAGINFVGLLPAIIAVRVQGKVHILMWQGLRRNGEDQREVKADMLFCLPRGKDKSIGILPHSPALRVRMPTFKMGSGFRRTFFRRGGSILWKSDHNFENHLLYPDRNQSGSNPGMQT